jgi:hypothetical protein
MTENLIIVGCVNNFRANVGRTLGSLAAASIAKTIATIDLQPLGGELSEPVGSLVSPVRLDSEPLTRSLREYRDANPVVVLSHSHDCHAKDALDLVASGFRAMLEKLTP